MWLGADRPGQPLTGKLQHTLTVVADEELASPTFAVEFAAPVPVLDGRRSAHLELNHHCGSRARAHCRRLRGAESPKRVQINQVGVPHGDRAAGNTPQVVTQIPDSREGAVRRGEQRR